MHQDQSDASHVRAYAYAYGRLYIYGPLALEIARINQVNQQVKEASIVTSYVAYMVQSPWRTAYGLQLG